MPNLLIEPPINMSAKWRPYRGKPFTRAKRRASLQIEYPIRRFGFVPEIQPSTSSGKMRNPSEKSVYDLLVGLGLDPLDKDLDPVIEPYALKILRNGTSNGQIGWFVPDFYVCGVEGDGGRIGTYIEVSMGDDLSNKLHKIRFVAERYGKLVIHITRDNIKSFIDDPDSLLELITNTRMEELDLEVLQDEAPENVDIVAIHDRLGTKLEPRIKIEKARKPSKAKRRTPASARKKRERPSRDLERRAERRALRKRTREWQRDNERQVAISPYLLKQNRKAENPITAQSKAALKKSARVKAPVPIKSKQYRQMIERNRSDITTAA